MPTPKQETATRVACPRCSAAVGEACSKRGGGFHVDRERAANAQFCTYLWRCDVHGLVSHVFDDTDEVWVTDSERHDVTTVRCNVHQPAMTHGYESEPCGWEDTGPFRATLDAPSGAALPHAGGGAAPSSGDPINPNPEVPRG